MRSVAIPNVQRFEALGVSHLLIAQRWWGNAQEIEGSSLDCLAMTTLFGAATQTMQLVTAIHPGFFAPAAIAKWGATMDVISAGRWGINVTSGWNQREFEMFGIDFLDHGARYRRSGEFISVLRGAWSNPEFSFAGEFYQLDGLALQPRPTGPIPFFQGGQSDDAIAMAAEHSDWMFLNGGTPERIAGVIDRVRAAAEARGRRVRFALYAHPLCRSTSEAAWAEIDDRLGRLDGELVAKRKARVGGASGMWHGDDDPLSHLDSNEGFCSRLIGSPDDVVRQIEVFQELGVEMLHLALDDELFIEQVLPALTAS